MPFEDKTLTCVECHQPFPFTARDQEFHASKGFTNEPKRCRSCRQARRAERGERPTSGGGADRGARRGERRSPATAFQEPAVATLTAPDEGPRSYTATCNACGGEAVLDSEPTGNRAVLCSACYDKLRAFV